jgi:arginine deiminase
MRRIENSSPLYPITEIATFVPSAEVPLSLLLDDALYEPGATEQASILEARKEHRQMVEAFESYGIKVIDLRRALGKSLVEDERRSFNSVNELISMLWAKAAFLKATHGVGELQKVFTELEKSVMADVAAFGEHAAIEVNAALTGLVDSQKNKLEFDELPLANMMFARDFMHVTGGTLAISKMHYPIRAQETGHAKKALAYLGIEYKEVNTTGSIEGGDVMPLELRNTLFAAVGKAKRTDWSGVGSWYDLHEKSFSASGEGLVPIVVDGPKDCPQDQMHLDLVSSQVGIGAMIFCGELARQRTVGTLVKKNGHMKTVDQMPMTQWVERYTNDALDITRDEQRAYATNLLLHGRGPGKLPVAFLTRADTPRVTEFIRRYAEVVQLHLIHLTKFYGGLHCLTTEFRAR